MSHGLASSFFLRRLISFNGGPGTSGCIVYFLVLMRMFVESFLGRWMPADSATHTHTHGRLMVSVA